MNIERLAPDRDTNPRRRVLFVTANGHGLGHVSRMMAVARRLPADIEPRFVTLSKAYPVIEHAGFHVDYIPSHKEQGGSWAAWNEMAKRRLLGILAATSVDELVLDHVRPWKFLKAAKRAHPDLTMSWCRRGLWKPDRNTDILALGRLFDKVLEPMDLASIHDRGATTTLSGALRVPPVTLLDRTEMLGKDAARRALGLPLAGHCVLLQLSADSAEQLHLLVETARNLVRQTDPDASLLVPIHPLHPGVADRIDGVATAPRYPMSRFFAAFDYAVSTAGYNTFHELIVAGVPTLFIARETSSLDNQALRASTAPRVGFGLHITTLVDTGAAHGALVELADPRRRRRMRAAATELIQVNGAQVAAALLSDGAATGRT